jgi:cobalamin synthesis protein cobW-like protein
MLLDAKPGKRWDSSETRQSRFVFIGRHLDRVGLQHGFLDCAYDSAHRPVAQPVL